MFLRTYTNKGASNTLDPTLIFKYLDWFESHRHTDPDVLWRYIVGEMSYGTADP